MFKYNIELRAKIYVRKREQLVSYEWKYVDTIMFKNADIYYSQDWENFDFLNFRLIYLFALY